MKQEMMGWQWQQLDNMQIIAPCSTISPLSFYRPDSLTATCHPTNSIKAL